MAGMDQDRQIRHAIPPFFLFASLLWGAHLGGYDLSPLFKAGGSREMLGVLAAGIVLVLPIGYLIGTVSVALLRTVALIFKVPTYETVLCDASLDRVWGQLRSQLPKDRKKMLYAAVTFDHELLAPGTHQWIMRRWNSFNVAVHSIVALLLAHLIAAIFSIHQVFSWWLSTLFLIALLGWAACVAWHETMSMIDFQSYRQQEGGNKS